MRALMLIVELWQTGRNYPAGDLSKGNFKRSFRDRRWVVKNKGGISGPHLRPHTSRENSNYSRDVIRKRNTAVITYQAFGDDIDGLAALQLNHPTRSHG
jgi:hypothetical protein